MYLIQVCFVALVCFVRCESDQTSRDINNFDDNILFRITWPGTVDSSEENAQNNEENALLLTTLDNEKYQCVIPATFNSNDDDSLKYEGPSAIRLLSPLFERASCSYRLEQFWTYELCHGHFIRQYHEENTVHKKSVQEFVLGKYDTTLYALQIAEQEQLEASWKVNGKVQVPTIKLEGLEMPYVQINMTDGTLCDLTGENRQCRVRYVCTEDAKHEIYSLKETASCEYEVIVLSPLLCAHPAYKTKVASQNDIRCRPKDMSPPKPLRLLTWEDETLRFQQGRGEPFVPISIPEEEKTISTPFPTEEPTISPDPELLRNFLNGDYCLHGGSGWWKYEFCYGKKVEQYHEERGGLKTTILLGKWDKQEHIAWLAKNPQKRPHPGAVPRHVSHFYSQGSHCDETQKPRHVEVKLKCKEVKGHPEAVTLYLLEPNICEYILGVESPLLCPLLEKVDEHGLFHQR